MPQLDNHAVTHSLRNETPILGRPEPLLETTTVPSSSQGQLTRTF